MNSARPRSRPNALGAGIASIPVTSSQTAPTSLGPAQGLPSQGLPSQGLPSQGLPSQGLPSQGLPSQGLPSQGLPQLLRPTPLSSMRARMTLMFALGIAVVMGGGSVGVYEWAKHNARQEIELSLQQMLGESREEVLDGEHNLRQPAEFLHEEGNEAAERGIFLYLLGSQGKFLGKSKHAPTWPPPTPRWITRQTEIEGRVIVVAASWAKREHELHEFRYLLCGLTLLVVMAGAFGSWVVVGRTLQPLNALSQQAQVASVEDLRVRLQSPSDDVEMLGLVVTLNGLLTRIGESAASRGRFYAAASHELRTPLQVLSGHLELALSRPRSNQEYHRALEEAHAGSRRLIALTQELLLLNQLETRSSTLCADDVDLCDVVERALGPLQALADGRTLLVSSQLPNALVIQAPWNHVEMLVRNLLENAIKYADPGGEVRIRAQQDASGAELQVFNTYPAQAEWDEMRLFEPFYRPDTAREGATGGNGLGLAICKAICEANGWHISLSPSENGVCAQIRFKPVAQS